jgi:serralysin
MTAIRKGKPGPAPQPETTTTPPTGDQQVDGVLSGREWATNSVTGVTTVTYSFPNSYSDYGKGYSEATSQKFQPLNSAEQAAVRSILGQVDDFAKLTFVENTGTSDASAQIRIGNTVTPGADAWAYYPASGKGGDVWFDKGGGGSGLMRHSAVDLQPGDYTYTVFMHELGHALGLKHSFENTSFGLVPIDSLEYTVMSYDAYVGAGNTWATDGNNPQTFMMYDIAALQYMYGANYATNGGNTIYVWSPANGGLTTNGTLSFDTPGTNNIFMTVWDGGGIDTYDFSNYTTDLRVDLRPGGWTILDTQGHLQLADLSARGDGTLLAAGNIANALVYDWNDNVSGAGLIENATGGIGNDTIIGNSVGNVLTGGEGDDELSGGNGKDSLTGGAGNDIFDYNTLLESGINSTTWDVINDFVTGQDKIDLATLDADSADAADDAFAGFIAGNETFTTAGQLQFTGGVLYGNTDIDSTAEFAIQLVGIASLSASDLLL